MVLKEKGLLLFSLRNLGRYLEEKREQRKSNILILYISFRNFKELSLSSYQVLRKNSHVLVTLLRIMLCSGIPELKEKSISNYYYNLN